MQYPNSYYLPGNWPKYAIRLTEKGSLEELFSAGLRPEYIKGSENYALAFKHARLNFVLSNGQNLPEFAVEYAELDVNPSGLLMLKFVSQPLSIEEAKVKMLQWLPFFNQKNRKTKSQLENFLSEVSKDYSGYDDPDFGAAPKGFGGSHVDVNKIGYGVSFQKAYNEILPVRIYFRIGWHRLRTKKEQRESFDYPIPAPKGYSITIAESFGPDDTAEMMYAKGIAFPEGFGLGGSVSNVVEKPEPKDARNRPISSKQRTQKSQTADATEEKNSVPIWLWVSAGLILLGAIGVFLKSRRSG